MRSADSWPRWAGLGDDVTDRRGGEGLAVLIEHSAELKRDLVDFACSPRLERSLASAMLEAGLEEELEEADAIGTTTSASPSGRLGDRHPPGRALPRRSPVNPR